METCFDYSASGGNTLPRLTSIRAGLSACANSSYTQTLGYNLFGNIISITDEDVLFALFLGGAVFLLLSFYQKELMYLSFDEVSAKVSGVPVSKLNTLLIVLTAIMVVISIRIVGILLISSFLIIPPAAALQISRSFKQTLFLSALFGLISLVIGLFASYYFDLASGGSVVMSSIVLFALTFLYKKVSN
jgi:zinc transport system permease protein